MFPLVPAFFFDITDNVCSWHCLFLILVGLLLHAFFELVSVALVRARHSRIEELLEVNYTGAKLATKILERSEGYLICCQIWSFMTAFLVGAVTLGMFLPAITITWTTETQSVIALIATTVLYLLVPILILAIAIVLVQIAKSIAYAKPNRMLCYSSYVLRPFYLISSWAVFLLKFISEFLIRVLRLELAHERDFIVSAEEINEIVERSSKAGELEHDEHVMIKSALEFAETVASEIMTPRNDVIAASLSASFDEIIGIFKTEGHTRVLIYGENLDDFKGIVNAKDFVPLITSDIRDTFILRDFIRQVPAISSSMPIQKAMQVLRKQSAHFAVVLDEYGGLNGIITIEDIVEEVVGDIYDEYDLPEDQQTIAETKSGDLILDGGALIDDLNSEYELDLPVGDYNTIAGFMIQQLAKIPMPGDSFVYKDFLVRAEDVSNNRINLVKLSLNKKKSCLAI